MNKRIFLRKILNTENFFFIFAKYLDEIFPRGWHKTWDSEFDDALVAIEGTVGWDTALKLVLNEFGMEDCFEYYDSLYWGLSDEVDSDIAMLLEAIVFDENGNRLSY